MKATPLPLRALLVLFLWLRCFPIAVLVMPISLSSNVTHLGQSRPPTKLAQLYCYRCFYQLSTSSLYSFSSVQLLSCVWPHELQHTRPPCLTNSWSLPKLMSIESVMPSSHLILGHPLLLLPPILSSIRVFPVNQLFAWGGQSIGVSASASVLPVNTQDWSPLGWTSWISLQSKGLSRVFSNTTVQKHQFFSAQLSLQSNSHIHTWVLEKP